MHAKRFIAAASVSRGWLVHNKARIKNDMLAYFLWHKEACGCKIRLPFAASGQKSCSAVQSRTIAVYAANALDADTQPMIPCIRLNRQL